ncbi:MAG TPA: PAAR domain-containing protein [Woeseiaceae bacterium]|nr:PAAR domain-containing protein [Woeseiaceae bacterium]
MNKLATTVLAGVCIAASIAVAAQQPAARVTDPMSLAGTIVGPGATTVLIDGMPAARVTDQTTSALVVPPGRPCVGGPIISGSATVLIEGLPAARTGDQATTTCGMVNTIVSGAPTVLIGD